MMMGETLYWPCKLIRSWDKILTLTPALEATHTLAASTGTSNHHGFRVNISICGRSCSLRFSGVWEENNLVSSVAWWNTILLKIWGLAFYPITQTLLPTQSCFHTIRLLARPTVFHRHEIGADGGETSMLSALNEQMDERCLASL